VKNLLVRRWLVLPALLSWISLTGCASLPTSAELEVEHEGTTTGCEESREKALACAHFLRDSFAALESNIGKWDTAYAYTAIGVGSLTAIYLKSATDRSQALEDLAVAVATLAGIHGVWKPAERLKLATQGRKSVECMIQSVQAISVLKEEAVKEVTAEADGVKLASLRREQESAQRQAFAVNAKWRPGATQANEDREAATAAANEVARVSAEIFKLSPMQRFNLGVDREFRLGEPEQLSKSPRGLLLQQQGRQLSAAKDATRAEAKAADTVAAQRLSYGLHQVLNNARLALSNLSSPGDSMVIAQRDAVQAMIGDLAKAVAEEQKQSERTIGAAGVAADSDDTNTAASHAATEARSAGRVRLQQVYEQCSGDPS
jgi:hypothetical protein